ncbi:MAG: NAD-glutamate dehydrogenase [Rhodospirillales bacterium]|nr:NAD-glutamate dehydrogenase [Rhodospirillales bacterium]
MSSKNEPQAVRAISKIVAAAKKGVSKPKGELAERYLRYFYGNVPASDLTSRSPEIMATIALNQMRANETRQPGRANIRLFNPTQKTDGWTAERTVVEISTDDMPFIVDSITAELTSRDLATHSIIHPIIPMVRTAKGKMQNVAPLGTADPDVSRESFIHIEITQQTPDYLKDLKQKLEIILSDVRCAVEDWRSMRHRMWALIEELETGGAAGHAAEEVAEGRDFLRWIHDNHFTFLGYRDYTFTRKGKRIISTIDKKSGLGILRNAGRIVFEAQAKGEDTPTEVKAFLRNPDLLMVTKTNERTTVHRPVHMDAIAIKRLDEKGNVIGQRIFVGLFTSVAYNRSPREIPMLRQKLDRTVQRAGFRPASHDGKNLTNILETFPRDELFQVSDDELFETAMGILHLEERARVALFVRKDDLERHMSCMVFVPRDRFDTDFRKDVGKILAEAFNGRLVAFRTQFGDGPLARVHFIVKTTPGKIPAYDVSAIEAQMVAASRSWKDNLIEAMSERYNERETTDYLARYGDAFGLGYQEQYGATSLVTDMEMVDQVLEANVIGMNLYDITGTKDALVRFKLYHPDSTIPLSDVLPLFEDMGFRVIEESPHRVEPNDGSGRHVMMHDFGLEAHDGKSVNCDDIRTDFLEAFFKVWYGQAESDGFNGLVCAAGMSWRSVSIIRAYCKYLRQAGIPYSQSYMEQTLLRNAGIARKIVDLFKVQFDPDGPKTRDRDAKRIHASIISALEKVTSADEDRIIRRFVNVVDCSLRTNFYQVGEDGNEKPYLSIKLKSREIDELPLPRPFREIFVYSPRIEGVHLRFGMVARGGLRWSDRPEDFRTEVLGLVKAQQVKNSVIVPVGSKGGFVLKQAPTERNAFMEEGIACYKLFISALLDITDNIKGKKIIAPKRVVRRDSDDAYLVVAADKGTATFSDYANGVSIEYGHWLGDAFASGGSQGYDHKGMGITAKGAWECVKRHFREIGTDIQNEDFSVIGVGDMSGDVFGNGMLLSKHIKLIGAFNHLHIFVDPNPDPAKTWVERKRLFDMGRSSWTDYDKKLMSKGAALYERSAKTLKLTPEIKKLFGFTRDKVTPNELLKTMLQAQVDLLWFGGIGTYIKADSESHADAGDRANDAIRTDGGDLRAQVIGEGANLGTTQLGRIEYAMSGGRLNTDAIDNSAGVDCSDHEVNIKILIDHYVASGKMTEKQRNKLLATMTDEVGDLVLMDNYQQGQAITLIQSKGVSAIEGQMRFMRFLERQDLLNRDVEYLPNDEEITERIAKNTGLTRPEQSVVLAYAKNWLYDEVLASSVPDDAATVDDLVTYFPTPVRKTLLAGIKSHRLRREIIATTIINSLVNRVGDTFVHSFMEKTGMPSSEIVRAFVIARDVYDVQGLWDKIEALDNKVPASVQTEMLVQINDLLERGSMWFLQNGKPGLDMDDHIADYGPGVTELIDGIEQAIPAQYMDSVRDRAAPLIKAGVPKALATSIAGLVNLTASCDIVHLAKAKKLPVMQVAKANFAVGARFKLGRLMAAAEALGSEGHWQQLAVDALISEMFSHQLNVTSQVLDTGKAKATAEQALNNWAGKNAEIVSRAESMLTELRAADMSDLSIIAVASRQLRTLTSE